MLMYQEMICTECGSAEDTCIEMIEYKNKRKTIRFKVNCKRCGCYSHMLTPGAIEEAVRKYIEEKYETDSQIK
jgi:uncharacterized Zn finger protein